MAFEVILRGENLSQQPWVVEEGFHAFALLLEKDSEGPSHHDCNPVDEEALEHLEHQNEGHRRPVFSASEETDGRRGGGDLGGKVWSSRVSNTRGGIYRAVGPWGLRDVGGGHRRR